MIRTPTLHSLDSSAFVDNLAAIPCGYFCEIGLNIVRPAFALRSLSGLSLFFEYIRKIRSFRTRLVTLNCILSQRDRRRSSRERGLQASPRPFLGLFFGLFIFLSFDTTPCPESGPRASSPL